MSVDEVGVLWYTPSNVVRWSIPCFSLLSQCKDTRIWSRSFIYCDNARKSAPPLVPQHQRFLGVIFRIGDRKEIPPQSVRIGIADMKNSEICCCHGVWTEDIFGPFIEVSDFVNLEILNRYLNSYSKNARFRLFCEEVKDESYQEGDKTCQSDNARVTVAAKKPTPGTGSGDKILKNCISTAGEVNSQDLKSLRKLSQNLKDLYVSGKHSDVLIKVKDREFKVHKAILTARSLVFDGMFSHDLSENNSGIVPIEDCEPAIFEEFIFFLYTGRIQNLSSDNACELYYVADKYDIPEMKEECISFLKKSLSTETICDVICLSTKCNETELLQQAITFFASNMEEIIITVKWLLFLKENPVEANELTIKALKFGFTKRNI